MKREMNSRAGYSLALLSAAVSGVAVYVNNLGVKLFADSTLYTTLKNAMVGLALIVPFMLLAGRRRELARLSPRKWGLLIALALISGSLPFLLFFRGLQLTNAVTGALLNHLQFVFVAVFAVIALRERINAVMWASLAVLIAGTVLGVNTGAVRWNDGALMVLASSVLFAAGFVLAKHLLTELSTLTVIAARMSLGSVALAAYTAATGHLGAVAHLGPARWAYVALTGAILLAFTVTTFAAIRRVRVSAVIAIQMAAPIVTLLLQSAADGRLRVQPTALAGLSLTLAAVAVIVVAGLKDEQPTPALASASG